MEKRVVSPSWMRLVILLPIKVIMGRDLVWLDCSFSFLWVDETWGLGGSGGWNI